MRDHDSLAAERAGLVYLGATETELHVLRLAVLLANATAKLPIQGEGFDPAVFVPHIHGILYAVVSRIAWRKIREVGRNV